MDLWKEQSVVYAADQITVVRADPHYDLFWVGDSEGRVASFSGPQMHAYTSVLAHYGPIKDIQISKNYVVVLGGDGVRTYKRNGMFVASNTQAVGDVLLLLDNEAEFLVGFDRRVKRFTLDKTIKENGFFELDFIPEKLHLTHLSLCYTHIAVGLSNGTLQILEPHTFDPILPKPITCHSGPITDLDTRRHILATCGLSQRRYGLVPDVFVSCYDYHARRSLPPLSVSTGASFVRIHPRAPSNVIILGSNGLLTFLDSKDLSSLSIKQAALQTPVVGLALNQLGDSFVIAEKSFLHRWSTLKTAQLRPEDEFKNLDVPDSMVESLPTIRDDTPLSAVGMPPHGADLLSEWDPRITFEVGMPTPDWDAVANSMIQPSHASTKARRHKNRRSSSVSVPRFLSEQARLALSSAGSPSLSLDSFNTANPAGAGAGISSAGSAYAGNALSANGSGSGGASAASAAAAAAAGAGASTAEQHQAFVDLVGRDDSEAKGKVPKIWRQLFVHYSKFGVDDFDFSFYNSTKYAGLEPLTASRNCNAVLQLYRWCPAIYNNLLHTFAANNWRDLSVMGELAVVLDMLAQANGYHCRATNFMDTIQCEMTTTQFHQQLLEQLLEEYKQVDATTPFKLDTQLKTLSVSSTQTVPSPAWDSLNVVDKPPSALMISINEGPFPRFGPRIHSHIWLDNGTINSRHIRSVASTAKSPDSYMLQGYIAEINDDGEKHAVAVIKVDGVWHLFNDFLVTNISEHEALDFSRGWKRPTLLYYAYSGPDLAARLEFDYGWHSKIDDRLLREPRRLSSGNWDDAGNPDAILAPEEPIPALVALDAEFVLIRKEISEVHSDGSKNLVSPKKLSLARLSVLRDDERVLIDDMVESKQPVVDYVTAYSGIEPGDLDPLTSRFGLVARKTATRKLWILLNKGTKFVGHALVNDFRTINLYVPPAQVIDTYNLFYDRDRTGMRRLSLKFLMWAVLDQQVQTGNHDSVQDAQSALRLYRKYEELLATNRVDEMLAEIAMTGQRYNYRVPNLNGTLNGNGGSTPSSTGSSVRPPSVPTTPLRQF